MADARLSTILFSLEGWDFSLAAPSCVVKLFSLPSTEELLAGSDAERACHNDPVEDNLFDQSFLLLEGGLPSPRCLYEGSAVLREANSLGPLPPGNYQLLLNECFGSLDGNNLVSLVGYC